MIISNYTDLYKKMITELPGCPKPLILQELQQSAADFCERTEAWKDNLNSFDLVADQTTYHLNAPYDATLQRILTVRINTAEGVTNGTEGALQDESLYRFDPAIESLVFTNAPSTVAISNALDIKAVLVPTVDAEGVAQWFLNRYRTGIVAGALASLAVQPDKIWSSQFVFTKYDLRWRQAINKARAEKNREFKGATPGFYKE